MLRSWEELPLAMQTEEVRPYYDILRKKRGSLFCKRLFDIVVSFVLLLLFSPLFLVLAIAIKVDSRGPVFYRQLRMTQYGKPFHIFKFRSMVQNADRGSQVTLSGDARVTRVGRIVRKYRLDEISQLIDVLRGKMTFVGTRPEVPRYTAQYTPEMMATFLLPAGVTSLASIYYKDEAELLDAAEDSDRVYVEEVLPAKMHYNLQLLRQFSFWNDIKIMFMTVFAVCGRNYQGDYSQTKEIEAEKVEMK